MAIGRINDKNLNVSSCMVLKSNHCYQKITDKKLGVAREPMVNGQWFIVSYDSANKQKHHKSHRMQ